MVIQASELKWYKSAVVNDTPNNGGVMSSNEIADGVKNNVWPDASPDERAAGSVKYRKTFIKVANEDNLTLITPKIFIETPTHGDDSVVLVAGTQTDTQSEAVGYTQFFGSGYLLRDVAAGDVTLDVIVEDGNGQTPSKAFFLDVKRWICRTAACFSRSFRKDRKYGPLQKPDHEIFWDGVLVRISDQAGGDGNSEFVRLADSNAVSWNGNQATLTFETGVSLTHAYLASDTKVASVIESDDIVASMSGWSEASYAGTYNDVRSALILDGVGTIEQTWTLTWLDASGYVCVGDTVGYVGNGISDGIDFAPNNPDFNQPYFTLRNGTHVWCGNWGAGDVVIFRTCPAAIGIWEKRTIPPGAGSRYGNALVVVVVGDIE